MRETYHSNHLLTEKDALCVECVKGKVRYVQLRTQIAEDAKKITELSKDAPEVGKANYWVGVKCFKNWRSFAMADDDDCGIDEVFNQEIVCKHGLLITFLNCSQLLTIFCFVRKFDT